MLDHDLEPLTEEHCCGTLSKNFLQLFPKTCFQYMYSLETLTGRAKWPKDPKAVSIPSRPQEQSQLLQTEEA